MSADRCFAALAVLFCGACGLSFAEESPPEKGPAIFVVRQPAADVAVSGMIAPQPILAPAQLPADGSEVRPFPGIGAALRAVPAGALLRIDDGIFRERLVVTRPVVLLGRGAGRTRIVEPADSPGPAVLVRSDHVEIFGLSVEGGATGVSFEGGAGHRLENVSLRGFSESALLGKRAEIVFAGGEISDVAGGKGGRGVDIDGGSIELRKLTLRAAGRRAVVVHGARGLLEGLEVSGSSLSALQATDHADVRVQGGLFTELGGAALYAGAARLTVDGAHVVKSEYAVIGFRGADLSVTGGEMTDYRVAGIALVNSRGVVQRVELSRGGTEAAISITGKGGAPVALYDNQIKSPGPMGVHVTESSVVARGNTITGARLDREKDMGDAFFAIASDVSLEQNVFRGNAGSGVSFIRSQVKLLGNSLIDNGRAGALLLDHTRAAASGNLFDRNQKAGMELGEQSHATLAHNRFSGAAGYDIDTGCAKQSSALDLDSESPPLRRRVCAE